MRDAKWKIMTLRRSAFVVCAGVALMVAAANSRAIMPGNDQGNVQKEAAAVPQVAARAAPNPVGFADIVDAVKPAVIGVRVSLPVGLNDEDEESLDRFLYEFAPPKKAPEDSQGAPEGRRGQSGRAVLVSQGAGFFISADGYAVTNNHLVGKSKTAEIRTDDDKTLVANVVGGDPKSDVALLKVDGRNDFPHVKFADRAPRVGDWALAVGNPFGLGSTVTAGIVSARGRDIGPDAYDDLLQLDAPVNQGSSGGPAINVNGEVIGVNTAIYSPSGGSVGIAFAVPADEVRKVVSQLQSKGTVTRGWIGLQVQVITPEVADGLGLGELKGALATEPQAGGPADKAGIKPGDIIASIDNKPIADTREFIKRIGETPPGTSIDLMIVRNGREQRVAVALGEFPKQETRGSENEPEPGIGPAAEPSKSSKNL
jgi:serine protease Do